MKHVDSFYVGVSAFFIGIILTELLFVTLQPSNIWADLLYQVPILIGLGWGGCWHVFPEIWRLYDGARYAPYFKKFDRFLGIAFICVRVLYVGSLVVKVMATMVL